jgi:hypothetical protein
VSVLGAIAVAALAGIGGEAIAQLQEQARGESPLEEIPVVGTTEERPKEKLARIWANEPLLVRLARDKFGDDLTETDAKFFADIAANEWADFRPSSEATYDPQEPSTWDESPTLKADRIIWLCSDPAASRHVSNHGIWIRGAKIEGRVHLYRCVLPYSLTFYDCLLDDGITLRNAKLQELDITNCCTAKIDARGVQIAENVYMPRTAVFGGVDFIEAQIAGDLDMDGGLAFHGTEADDVKKPGVSVNLYDAKIDGDVKLGNKFRAFGKVRLCGARIGRSLACADGQFNGIGESAIDADRADVGRNVSFSGEFTAEGCVDIRRVHIGGDLDCDGGQFNGADYAALNADLVEIAGQLYLGDGLNAKGEVRFISSVIAKDADCDNGHFLNPNGNALSFDSSVIGRSLRIGYDSSSATDKDESLPAGFVAHGTVRLYGTHINQDLLAGGGQFEAPSGQAIVACNLKVASRVMLNCVEVKGQVDLSAADIEHELDLRGSHFDGSRTYNRIAIWANGMKVRGHVYCNQFLEPDKTWTFSVDGLMSFQFVDIDMSWNLYGAKLLNAGGDALDVSDCHVGGYVNLENVDIAGRVSFSRAKIDGMWILCDVLHPERVTLDMRFAHVWVLKDDSLNDWPPAGQLQLEGFVYDHFDDDSPLTVDDRLQWLRRQYAPNDRGVRRVSNVRRGSPHPAATADRRSSIRNNAETFGHLPVRGRETRAQHDAESRAQQGAIIPVEFEAAPSMPAPSATAGAEQEPPAMMAAPPAAESAATMPHVAEKTDEIASETEDATTEDDAQEDATANTAPNTAAVDPAGRRYITQPYTQLASVYRAIGQDEQANTVLVARAERLGELAPALSAQGLWYRYFGRLIGYGYEPFRAVKIGVAIVLIGTIVFAIGAHRNLMAETKLAERVISQENESGLVTTTYPRFNPFVYSLDVFLPFVELHQICYWIPGERNSTPRSRNCLMHIGPYSLKWSGVLRTYFWFQTLAGWTLCTLLAAAVTGIVES